MPLPLFYFQPTVCWVDDDQLFLEAVNISFANRSITFNHPELALNFFKNYQSSITSLHLTRELIESDIFGATDHIPIDINVASISQFATNPKRFDEIAVMVVDYNMPSMNGLEVCKQLQHLPIKKILLTGNANHTIAVEAFNHGLIHQFIRKDQGITEQLNACIEKLTFEFFSEQTTHLLAHLPSSQLSPLSDPIFMDFFKIWCKENEIQEFYLINRQGSFLVKDKNNKTSYFIVMSNQDKEDFIKLHDDAQEHIGKLLDDVSQGKILPFFGVGKEAWEVELNHWEKYFFASQHFQGKQKYYWANISNTA